MALLNCPKLDLPDAQETLAFEAVDKVIRLDPVLKTVFGRNIYSWRGDALDEADPSLERCPWIRLTPVPEASAWANVGQHKMPMNVGIELAVAGTRVREMMNLFGAIRAAIFPQGPAQRAAVDAIADAARITKATLAKPAYGTRKDSAGNKLLYAMGRLELVLLIDT